MDDACRDALAGVGRKVIPASLRTLVDGWDTLDDYQRAAVVADVRLVEAALSPAAS